MSKYYVCDIEWDTSGSDYDEDIHDLPLEMDLPDIFDERLDAGETDEVYEEIGDFLADQYGFLVDGFYVGKN